MATPKKDPTTRQNNHYSRGRAVEYRICAELEAAGYLVTRAASSKGKWDVIAINAEHIRLISSKRASTLAIARRTLAKERKALKLNEGSIPSPAFNEVQQELWVWCAVDPDGKGTGGHWFAKEIIA